MLVLFGGIDGVYLNDAWTFSMGCGWTQIKSYAVNGQPYGRRSSTAVVASDTTMLIYAGYYGSVGMILNDVYRYDVPASICATPTSLGGSSTTGSTSTAVQVQEIAALVFCMIWCILSI